MANVLDSCELSRCHSKQPTKQNLAGKTRATQYPSDSEDSALTDSTSDSDSDLEYEVSGDERTAITEKETPSMTSLTGARPMKPLVPQSTSTVHTKKPYACTHAGCYKSYRKPSRLQEHERSHTGERPFVCSECGNSYLRDSHLRAHIRSHLPSSALIGTRVDIDPTCGTRGLCENSSDANMRSKILDRTTPPSSRISYPPGRKTVQVHAMYLGFWQAQRITTSHSRQSSPGTKPYRCEHTGCTKSFATNQKLKSHTKVHDATRYACAHPDCSNDSASTPVQFPTWSLLQEHMRSAHPPKCPYAACEGRTFASSKGLRGHLKTHRDRELEASYATGSSDTSLLKRPHQGVDSTNESSEPPPKRRRGGEVGRDWLCPIDSCAKTFKSKKAQQDHMRVSHEGLRKFECPDAGCDKTFGYKHVMQRHLERHHRPQNNESALPKPNSKPTNQKNTAKAGTLIGLLTGQDYDESPQSSKSNAPPRPRLISCPWPSAFGTTKLVNEPASSTIDNLVKCAFKFSRAYDLRRHLRSAHGLEAGADEVNAWVLKYKQ
ncbi:C2H2 zinc finger [Rhizoctonia solani]|uniref:C2H2 zinc finger n=1 Tax=Rhizoctonia solani TaxID=456999 RepID=A0A8H8SSI0_9AGAM|nr:C2H2 zinc finger [Rhizoctonia solani]QRW16826.1 C2H2 zinc finger [Rhizoctonia solani]